MDLPSPVLRYSVPSDAVTPLHSSAELITHAGRTGMHFTSIHGRASLPRHNVGQNRGTVVFWVLPLQDYHPAVQFPSHRRSNPFFDRFIFLSDREAVQEFEAANFVVGFLSSWHPVLLAKFSYGTIYHAAFGPRFGAMASAGYFKMSALTWYQMAVTWDRAAGLYCLYANGVKVGHSDVWGKLPLPNDPPARTLFFGNPSYAMGDISFFDDALEEPALKALFEQEATGIAPGVQRFLEQTYQGRDLPKVVPEAPSDPSWQKQLSLSLKDEKDYAQFFLQGTGPSVRFEGDGMRLTTPGFDEYYQRMGKTLMGDQLDMTRMYLWTRRVFHGDLTVSVEFKLHQHGGLALLIAQAAGMQGEDFLADYPLRSDGSMSVVHKEDVRNYHWEFYREIGDTRNDLVSHAALKNPWMRPLSFQVEPRRWELDRWYRLTFVQEGAHLCGMVDGIQVLEATDNGFENSGPVLRHGHLALRAMMRTDITFRNLEVWTRPEFQAVPLNTAAG
ncbi:MAG: DUF1961 family protein [Chthoniobacteraceae bacterium]|nr:DUF1961 family protein [Chthoniobacteraceae bacterium]